MDKKKTIVGFAICGSFCTFKRVLRIAEELSKDYDLIPIMSQTSYFTDTRFGKAAEHIEALEKITGKKVLHNLTEVEPFGPKKILDAIVVAPCTGNTLAKLANGITDTSVTLATKAHLRNMRPVVIAVSTNDALSGAGKNIGKLFNYKNMFFVPFRQDSFSNKPYSTVADFTLLPKTVENALNNVQLQPILDTPIE
jgi:dipicolinate synthase subunit B